MKIKTSLPKAKLEKAMLNVNQKHETISSATLEELQSFVSYFSFAVKLVVPGCISLQCIYENLA